MNTIFKLIAVVSITICSVQVAYANHPWGGYHWAVTNPTSASPAVLKIGDNLTATDWQAYLLSTISYWNIPDSNSIPDGGRGLTPTSNLRYLSPTKIIGTAGKNCSAVTGTTQVCNKTYGKNGWLGLAQIWISGGHIIKGTAKLNDSYFSLAYYNNPSEKLHVMCQEVAHTFGLGHQDTSGAQYNSCMDYYNNRTDDGISTVPNTHDFGQLEAIYKNHNDGSTLLSSTAMAALKNVPSNLDNPSDWGRRLTQSPEGRSSTYEKLYAGGIRILTHVTWTVEAASKCTSCDHRFEARE